MKKHDEVVIEQEQNLELILFSVADRLLAIDIGALVEIVEALPVSPLPFVPDYVDGLINVNGRILPQINLASLVFKESSDSPQNSFAETILIVNVHGIYLALKIALVKESLSVEPSQITFTTKTNVAESGAVKNDDSFYLLGEFDYAGQTVLYFDVNSLKDIVRASEQPSGKPSFLGKVTQTKFQAEVYHEYLIAEVANREFAFELDDVAEIYIVDVIKSQPRAPRLIAGITLVRGEPRLVINMADLLGFKTEGEYTGNAMIMVKFDDMVCGVLADKMVGLESIKQNKDKKNKTILREDGHTLTQVINFSELFTDGVLSQIRPYVPEYRDAAEQVVINQIEFLRFEIAQDAYAFRLSEIRRVVSGKAVEPLLSEHAFIMGTIELDGKVIPVVNLVKQLGYTDDAVELQEFVIVKDGHNEWALAIGLSDQIVKIDENKIDMVKNQHVKYVSGFVSHSDVLITVLNIHTLCSENQHAVLA